MAFPHPGRGSASGSASSSNSGFHLMNFPLGDTKVKEEENSDRIVVPTSTNTVGPVPPKVEPLDFGTSSGPFQIKEGVEPSSSVSYLKSHFVGMGFSQALVDKVLQEHGDGDANSILETLFTYSALENPGAESSSSLDGFFSSDDEEKVQVPHGPTITENDVDSKPSVVNVEKRSFLLNMNFLEHEVDLALQQLGGEAPIELLIDHIVTAQTTGGDIREENETKPSISGVVSLDMESNDENLYGLVEKTLYLLEMGFTQQEVSSAIERLGAHMPVIELSDFILASRLAGGADDVEDYKEYVFTGGTNVRRETNFSVTSGETCYKPSTSNAGFYYENKNNEGGSRPSKRAKNVFIHKTEHNNPFNQFDSNNTFSVNKGMSGARAAPGPPFFLYGCVLPVSQGTWRHLSQFLDNIEPEFVNSQSFSAIARKEGYIHNIPTDTRHHILPRPPTTIYGVMPYTRKWWPSWDPRKQLNSMIESEMVAMQQLCDQLGKTVRDSHGAPSRESQTYILNKCNSFNLMWVGENKLAPLQPQQLEQFMGYPINHTSVLGIDQSGRLKTMAQCFQTDTTGHILSPLKELYPDGIRVLSIFSGIGGAEVALCRLGIRLKCVVSVESSEINREILKRWWSNTEQRGELRQLGEISKLTNRELENLAKEFGGFDLIIGAPDAAAGGGRGGGALNGLVGIDSNQIFEFVRVVKGVRSIMSKNT